MKNKILSGEILFNFQKNTKLLNIANLAILSDMKLGEELILGKSLINKNYNIRSFGIAWEDPLTKKLGLLINPPQWQYENLWVLIPKHDNSFARIGQYLSCVIENQTNCEKLYE
jgi:hypothetical protein